jgi:hypothetical protein
MGVMKHYRETNWACVTCGQVMDAASSAIGLDRPVEDGDVALCVICGTLYIRRGAAWAPLQDVEMAALTEGQKAAITQAQGQRRLAAYALEEIARPRETPEQARAYIDLFRRVVAPGTTHVDTNMRRVWLDKMTDNDALEIAPLLRTLEVNTARLDPARRRPN